MFTYILLTFGVAQDPCFQDKVSLKETPNISNLRTNLTPWANRTGRGITHLVPTIQRPLPPLEEISFTDTRGGHVMRAVTSCVHVYLEVIHHFPVFDNLWTAWMGKTHTLLQVMTFYWRLPQWWVCHFLIKFISVFDERLWVLSVFVMC